MKRVEWQNYTYNKTAWVIKGTKLVKKRSLRRTVKKIFRIGVPRKGPYIKEETEITIRFPLQCVNKYLEQSGT